MTLSLSSIVNLHAGDRVAFIISKPLQFIVACIIIDTYGLAAHTDLVGIGRFFERNGVCLKLSRSLFPEMGTRSAHA